MKIKASSIQNLTDARYFAAWHVEWLGFSLELGHANYTRPQDVKEIKDWLVGPKIVGEFGFAQLVEEIEEAVTLLNLDAIQLSPFTEVALLERLQGHTILQEYSIAAWTELADFKKRAEQVGHLVDYFILDLAQHGLTWAALQRDSNALELLQFLCQEYALLLQIVCPPDQLGDFIATVQPHGLNLRGGEEERVGVKSFDDLDAVFETLEDLDLIDY
jgi:phosphoribosylanthranilate isomerase